MADLPEPLRQAIRKVGIEYVRAFNQGVEVPLPQVISLEVLEAIKAASNLRRVK